MLEHHLDRLAGLDHQVLVATTTNDADDPIAAIAGARHLTCYRGSEDHVLSRFHGCASEAGLDVVVRVTSDCPLIDPDVVAAGVDAFLELDDDYAYVSNGLVRTFPRGLDFEVFSAAALDEAMRMALDPVDIEHVTPYLHQNRNGHMQLVNISRSPDRSRYRITLDTAADLALLTTLIEEYRADELTADAIIALLDGHRELVAINEDVEQKKLGS